MAKPETVKVFDRHQSFKDEPLTEISWSQASEDVKAGLATWHSHCTVIKLKGNHPLSSGRAQSPPKKSNRHTGTIAQSLKPGRALIVRNAQGDKTAQAIVAGLKWAPIVDVIEGDKRVRPLTDHVKRLAGSNLILNDPTIAPSLKRVKLNPTTY